MSCGKFKVNQFRLFLYAAAYVLIHQIKYTAFKDTSMEGFTMESFIQRIMLSAVLIKEGKSIIRINFVKGHRHRAEMLQTLRRIAA
ncbi:transposase [Bacteroides sp. UBA939]|uniref:transposase n=1 Tax=Bacteroides sp. UBA939 TaxID=1946092 RepID=UPI0039C88E8D